MTARCLFVALVLGYFSAAGCGRATDGAGAKGAKSEAGIEGTWNIVTMDSGGGPKPSPGIQMVISRDRLSLRAPSGDTKLMGDVARLDSAKSPGEIDLRNQGEVGYGIFALEGDNLSLVIADPGQPRPTAFQGSRKGMLWKLRRAR
jgi:uncharacterized protein (TIGR03067 family)